jgi:hypothetical protein
VFALTLCRQGDHKHEAGCGREGEQRWPATKQSQLGGSLSLRLSPLPISQESVDAIVQLFWSRSLKSAWEDLCDERFKLRRRHLIAEALQREHGAVFSITSLQGAHNASM